MAYTNSSLVTYKRITKNRTSPRNHAIDTITIHCIVGQWTAKQGCDYFATTDRECSSNYVVGRDGSIGLSVEEKDRSWCSSSRDNDHRAITIEVASDTKHPYAVNDKAYAAMLDLVTDICRRNGIKKLVWSTDKNKRMNHLDGCNMTVHRDYANKSCPGDYLYNRHGEIAAEVNRRLGAAVDTPTEDKPTTNSVKVGDTVKISSTATYYGGKAIPAWVKAKNWIVREVSGDRAIIDKSVDGKNAICSPINTKYLSVVSAASTPSQGAWTPQVGDYVSFTGKVHYASSNSDREVSCKGGKAKITQIYTKGKHPYHLVNMGGGCTVYGWVDRNTFTKA